MTEMGPTDIIGYQTTLPYFNSHFRNAFYIELSHLPLMITSTAYVQAPASCSITNRFRQIRPPDFGTSSASARVASRVGAVIGDESFCFGPQGEVRKKDVAFSVEEGAREGEIASCTTFLMAILCGMWGGRGEIPDERVLALHAWRCTDWALTVRGDAL